MENKEFKWFKEKIGEEKLEELLFRARQSIWLALMENYHIGEGKSSTNERAEMVWDVAQNILGEAEDELFKSEKEKDLAKMRKVYGNLVLTNRDGLLVFNDGDDIVPFGENGRILEAVNAYLVEHGKEPMGWKAYSRGGDFDKFWPETKLEGVYFFAGKDRKGYFVCFAKGDKDPTWIIVDKEYVFH